ncbi:peptidase C12, ubiquitin carboxyl-terminal hydrolase [Zychaea mexicana]|uniref:peptidase C12, ubiquitin carboxyl-terminal hydrolase n=1 Tax=Zychaea mexicana TaxID=64656 RepID=UPI0022FEAEAE|nr:peptidase C12, ubiquitin carboxyl-terminal hydrolase [Zychaea mexicana]KAI9494678.1 peptidase C12, ubiquitin carboxyl-terminal hydrolase [Zychaea mexicana]
MCGTSNVQLVHENGIDRAWTFNDVYGFDADLLGLIPRPVKAINFLYPTMAEGNAQYVKEQEARIIKEDQTVSPHVMYFKQTIHNACGMMALIHSLANNSDIVGPGLFRTLIDKAQHLTVDERVDLLETSNELASVHETAGRAGETQAPAAEAEVEVHYACFTEMDGDLYELDGGKPFPINHGPCTDLVEGEAAKVVVETAALHWYATSHVRV